MQQKVLVGIMFTLVLESILASESCPLFNEKRSIDLGKKVASGNLIATKMVTKVNEIQTKDLDNLREKSEFVKNLYLAYYYSGEMMSSFRSACLLKMLEVSATCTDIFKTESPDYALSVLLYYSQVSDKEDRLLDSANVTIIETVINRLSSAVNGDKKASEEYLQKFYKLLEGTNFSAYVPSF